MTNNGTDTGRVQSLGFDDFMYFFLRLHKPRIRTVVENIRRQFPTETPEQLARRLIDSHTPMAFLGGSLLHLPGLIPGLSQTLEGLGIVMGASTATRIQLYMILEIALLYGNDIDDQARVPELMAVVATTGASVAMPLLVHVLGLNPLLSLPLAGLTATTTTQLIGNSAIRYYSEALPATSSVTEVPG